MDERPERPLNPQGLWNSEYAQSKAIPGSVRASPSKALLQYEELVHFSRFTPVLDLGCGNGRNAIYLASKGCAVEAVDASSEALGILEARAAQAGVQERITVRSLFLGDQWPIADATFALVLDSYVFCHYLDDTSRAAFRREFRRVLKRGGRAYSAAFSPDDEYYASFRSSTSDDATVVVDPNNNVAKRLYSPEEHLSFFSEAFGVIYQNTLRFAEVVLGRTYWRSIITLVMEPK